MLFVTNDFYPFHFHDVVDQMGGWDKKGTKNGCA
jgi:hypothetical protein